MNEPHQIIPKIDKSDSPKMLTIAKTEIEYPGVTTLYFNEKLEARPGQFVMIWLPGYDEKPMAIAFFTKAGFAITVEAKGVCTTKITQLKAGDKVGIRGPYGKGYTKMANSCVVAGGIGLSSISSLMDVLKDATFIIGARNKERHIFKNRYPKALICTDNGSHGKKGYVTEILEEEFKKRVFGKKFSMVYTCGPEAMMAAVMQLCEKYNTPCEVSLERWMKCGFGICGECMCDDKIVCLDGPVFNAKDLKGNHDFNKYALDKAGKRVTLREYYGHKTKLPEGDKDINS